MSHILKISKKILEIDKEYFDNYGGKGCYDKVYKNYTTPPEYVLSTLLENDIEPKTLLDAGCASGELVRDFRKLGIMAYGIEKNQDILKKCVVPKYCYNMDLLDLDQLDNDLFSVIYCNALMYCWPHQILEILKKFNKVVKEAVWLCNPFLEDPYFEDKYRKFLASEVWWEQQFREAGFKKITKNLFKKIFNFSS